MQKRKAGYNKARSQRQENIATHTQYLFIGLNKNQSEMTQFLTVHYHYTSDKALAFFFFFFFSFCWGDITIKNKK